jgi:hypothetical protein
MGKLQKLKARKLFNLFTLSLPLSVWTQTISTSLVVCEDTDNGNWGKLVKTESTEAV